MDAKQQACAHSSLSLACYFSPFIKALAYYRNIVQLFTQIVSDAKKQIDLSSATTVEEVYLCLKNVCLKSNLDTHQNVDRVEIYPEYYETETKKFFRIAIQYYLQFEGDGEEYGHYEAIDCIFNPTESPVKASAFPHISSAELSMGKMFDLLEEWPIYIQLKGKKLDYLLDGEEQ